MDTYREIAAALGGAGGAKAESKGIGRMKQAARQAQGVKAVKEV